MLTEEHIFPFQNSTNTVTAASGELNVWLSVLLKTNI